MNLKWNKDYPWEIAIDSAPGGQDRDIFKNHQAQTFPFPSCLEISSAKGSYIYDINGKIVIKDKLNDEQKWYALDSADTTAEALRLGSAKLMEQFYPEPEQAAPIPHLLVMK